MSTRGSATDSQIGLTPAEEHMLLQHQQVIQQQDGSDRGFHDRGRGTRRHSQPSSRAASAASSHSGRLLLDSESLGSLYRHLERVERSLEARLAQVG